MSGRADHRHSDDSRCRRSRFDSEPSPKRSRRDGKPDARRAHNVSHANSAEREEKHDRQLQGSSSREMPFISDHKAEGSALNKDSNEKNHISADETKVPSNPTGVPRSKSYFQHDERGAAGLGGRRSSRRENAERGWWKDSRDRGSDSAADRELHQREKAPRREDGNDGKVWVHDGFFEMETNPPPPPPPPPPNRKRPAFTEQKISADNVQNDRYGKNEDLKPVNGGNRVSNVERRDERGGRHERYPDRFEKLSPRGGGRPYRRDEKQSAAHGSRDRYGGGNGRFGRRESNGRQQSLHPEGGRVEKWKHDLYNEANKSPPPKNDKDQLAKIEALLAS